MSSPFQPDPVRNMFNQVCLHQVRYISMIFLLIRSDFQVQSDSCPTNFRSSQKYVQTSPSRSSQIPFRSRQIHVKPTLSDSDRYRSNLLLPDPVRHMFHPFVPEPVSYVFNMLLPDPLILLSYPFLLDPVKFMSNLLLPGNQHSFQIQSDTFCGTYSFQIQLDTCPTNIFKIQMDTCPTYFFQIQSDTVITHSYQIQSGIGQTHSFQN